MYEGAARVQPQPVEKAGARAFVGHREADARPASGPVGAVQDLARYLGGPLAQLDGRYPARLIHSTIAARFNASTSCDHQIVRPRSCAAIRFFVL